MDNHVADGSERPAHSVEPDKRRRNALGGSGHEVEAPAERVDDEVGSDEEKKTRRQE